MIMSEWETPKSYKINSGSEITELIEDEKIAWINVADGWIYNTHSNNTENIGTYRMRTDGTGTEKTEW
jgi:hypothetical protein